MTKNTYWNEGDTTSERIDHAANARKILEGYPGLIGNRPFDVAQVHATLALVEQQRIANLIRLNEQWENTGYDFADSVSPVLKDDVRAALGLE